MADPKGFLTTERATPKRRPVDVRIKDWKEVYEPHPIQETQNQAGRCMDCGIPFCHNGCPLGNLIPEWNDLVWRGEWEEASERLHATNNFPEFTGKLCPAPCEAACVVAINLDAVAIKHVEVEISEQAWKSGFIKPMPPERLTGKTVAIIGSGPAGLAAAQQLARVGHTVAVYERADRIGGLLRYGIPEFKMEKWVLDRRLSQMEAEGVKFRTSVNVGVDIDGADLLRRYDAIVLANGATQGRDLPVPGRELTGIYQAMHYLPLANRALAEGMEPSGVEITAKDKKVIIIGGGDTGADCLGTAIRQGASSIVQLEIMPKPPEQRPNNQPWPTYPMTYKVSSAHEEGGERIYAVSTQRFIGENGRLTGIELVEVKWVDGKLEAVPGTEITLEADLVLLAMGFTGPEKSPLIDQLGLDLDSRGALSRDDSYQTKVPGVFVCGDAGRGQSLIVWAIAEGRAAAASVDTYLGGIPSPLPMPVKPSTRPILV
ncbi:MAG: glutamate synthase subunit beta [Actinobacteria bacterium]|nr:glutamate synthase subunit beta [Actinomycetota bacterium]